MNETETFRETWYYTNRVGSTFTPDDEGLRRHDLSLRALVHSKYTETIQSCLSPPEYEEFLKFFKGLYLKHSIWSIRNLINIQIQSSSFYKEKIETETN